MVVLVVLVVLRVLRPLAERRQDPGTRRAMTRREGPRGTDTPIAPTWIDRSIMEHTSRAARTEGAPLDSRSDDADPAVPPVPCPPRFGVSAGGAHPDFEALSRKAPHRAPIRLVCAVRATLKTRCTTSSKLSACHILSQPGRRSSPPVLSGPRRARAHAARAGADAAFSLTVARRARRRSCDLAHTGARPTRALRGRRRRCIVIAVPSWRR